MSRPTERSAGRFALSALAFFGVVAGVPFVLVRVSTARFGSANPLGGVRSWDPGAIGDALRTPLGDDTVVDVLLRLCLCVVWVAVAVIVVNTVVEVVHQVRHRGMPMPSMRGLGWSQGVARFIAVGLLIVIPTTSVKPSLAQGPGRGPSPTPNRAPLVIEGFDHPTGETNRTAPSIVATMPSPAVQGATYTVQRGDSVFSIAADLANHDEQRTLDIADAILDLNLDAPMADGQRFSNPAYVEPGWVLRLPATFATGAPAAVAMPGEVGEVDVHVVVPGDTLWDIAEDEYGSGSEWDEIWEENAGDDMGGGRTFDDPNLILPGWELDLPDDEQPTEDRPVEPPSVEQAVDPPAVEPPIVEPSVETTTGTTAPVPAATEAELPAVVATDPLDSESTVAPNMAPTGATVVASTTSPSSTTVVPVGGNARAVDPGRTSAPDAPSPIRLEHAAMLAAGILLLVGIRRRQRLRAATPRSRIPEPRPEVVETELLLRRIEPGERGPRVDVACRSAAFHLIGSGVQIVVVQVSPDGEIALTLSGGHIPPAPWTAADDNVWHLPAGIPVELLGESARQVGMPCVAFTQLGVDGEGWEVLVDLEACGTLAVDAQPSQADAVVRGLAAGLATSLYAEVAHLVTVSMSPHVLLGHRNAHQAESIDAAFDHAASLVGSTSMNERSSFELRSLRTGGEMWEPAVVLLTDRDAVEQTDGIQLPEAGHGIALVAVVGPNGLPDAPARLCAEATEWILTVAGRSISMTPIGLDRADVDAVQAILHDAERPLIWMDDLVPTECPSSNGEIADSPGPEQPESDSFEPSEHAIVVQLLGAVEVRSAAGERAEFERSKTVELIAWLVTHRTNSTRGLARTALWELDVRDATFANVVSEARRGMARLVKLHDGEEWLARTLTEQLPLHPLVVSDAQLVEQRLAHARMQPPSQAIETLRPAVAMIDGMPFAGTSYLWPDAEGITSNLVLLAMSACTELAEHALSMGDIELVFEATGHGLTVLPAHEGLIALRMRAYAKAGDLAGVRQEWANYERVIVADAWSDGEPAPKLVALRRELLTAPDDATATPT